MYGQVQKALLVLAVTTLMLVTMLGMLFYLASCSGTPGEGLTAENVQVAIAHTEAISAQGARIDDGILRAYNVGIISHAEALSYFRQQDHALHVELGAMKALFETLQAHPGKVTLVQLQARLAALDGAYAAVAAYAYQYGISP